MGAGGEGKVRPDTGDSIIPSPLPPPPPLPQVLSLYTIRRVGYLQVFCHNDVINDMTRVGLTIY